MRLSFLLDCWFVAAVCKKEYFTSGAKFTSCYFTAYNSHEVCNIRISKIIFVLKSNAASKENINTSTLKCNFENVFRI